MRAARERLLTIDAAWRTMAAIDTLTATETRRPQAAMTPPAPDTATAPLDADGRLATNVQCVNCGYNLRTLSTDSVCPECAHPVSLSTRGQLLRFAAARWVHRLARGVLLLVVASLVIVLGWIAMIVMGFFMAFLWSTATGPPSAFWILITAFGLCWVAALVLIIIGLLFVTSRDPAARNRPEGLSARRLVRCCAAVLPLSLMTASLSWAMPPFLLPLYAAFQVVTGIVSAIGFVVLPLAVLRYLIGLLRRIPRRGLVTFAKIEFWGVLATGCLMLIGWAVMFATTRTAAFGPPATAVTTSGPAAGAPSVSGPRGMTYTYQATYPVVGPSGQAVTTVPTTLPTTMMVAGPVTFPSPVYVVAAAISTAGGCVGFALVIAGLVLLVLVRGALAQAARQAAENATEKRDRFDS